MSGTLHTQVRVLSFERKKERKIEKNKERKRKKKREKEKRRGNTLENNKILITLASSTKLERKNGKECGVVSESVKQ